MKCKSIQRIRCKDRRNEGTQKKEDTKIGHRIRAIHKQWLQGMRSGNAL